MAIRLPGIMHAKQILRRSNSNRHSNQSTKSSDVPKGYIAVYVGEGEMKRFLIPISFLNQPCFFKSFYAWQRKHMGLNIPWVVSQFPAPKTISLNALLTWVDFDWLLRKLIN